MWDACRPRALPSRRSTRRGGRVHRRWPDRFRIRRRRTGRIRRLCGRSRCRRRCRGIGLCCDRWVLGRLWRRPGAGVAAGSPRSVGQVRVGVGSRTDLIGRARPHWARTAPRRDDANEEQHGREEHASDEHSACGKHERGSWSRQTVDVGVVGHGSAPQVLGSGPGEGSFGGCFDRRPRHRPAGRSLKSHVVQAPRASLAPQPILDACPQLGRITVLGVARRWSDARPHRPLS